MPYTATISLTSLEGNDTYKSPLNGEHECVALVQALTGAPRTSTWKKGKKVMGEKTGTIRRGTAIATFDENGEYPLTERHAALYVSHSEEGIVVYHQYKRGLKPGKVHMATIKNKKQKQRTTLDADYYYIIE